VPSDATLSTSVLRLSSETVVPASRTRGVRGSSLERRNRDGDGDWERKRIEE
jgi:hypothetical protein